jgi:mono/diheme cytochrome c family protein
MKHIALVALIFLAVPAGAFAADAKAGQAVYDKACKSCHGATGVANPAIAKMTKVEMRDLGSPEVQAQTNAEWKSVMTDGKGKMKATKTVTGGSLDDVIAYMRTFKK